MLKDAPVWLVYDVHYLTVSHAAEGKSYSGVQQYGALSIGEISRLCSLQPALQSTVSVDCSTAHSHTLDSEVL